MRRRNPCYGWRARIPAITFSPHRGPKFGPEALYAATRKRIHLIASRKHRLRWLAGAGVCLTLAAAIAACAPNGDPWGRKRANLTSDLSETSLLRFAGRMDPAMRALAVRHDPGRQDADEWARTEGWEKLDMSDVPDLDLPQQTGETAEELNALRPFAGLPIRPMKPFRMTGGAEDRARALQCLSEAVYYEAAREPQLGQEAVAQVVLNRVRHPAYPKSVCGVVYQGSARLTGCQFTFTCDGSLRWKPEPALWRQARGVAERALDGHVARHVGSATHYHAGYVAPYWAPTLVKMTRVGAHIFYRWTGPWGEPAAFTGRYAGREAYLSPAVLGGVDSRTQGDLLGDPSKMTAVERKVTLALAGEVRTYTVADPAVEGGVRTRVIGQLAAPRRATPEEIRAINAKLEALEREMDGKPAAEAAPAAAQAAENASG